MCTLTLVIFGFACVHDHDSIGVTFADFLPFTFELFAFLIVNIF